MKKLFLIRHAKSSWEDFGLDDFDRPLNNRGEKDAPFMGKLLKKKKPRPDLIISSPALRTKQTAQIMAKEIGYDEKIVFDKTIYEAPLSNLKRAINNIDNSFNSIVFVGHNPGLHELAQDLCDIDVDNIPTCAIVEIEFDVDSWDKVSKKNAKLISYEYPKKYK